jgi:hydrogenase maturation protein HypF
VVQGVGFRPFVYGLATELRLNGFVKNSADGVLIEIEGEPSSLDRFVADLTTRPPPLARIDEVRWATRPTRGDPSFRIESSQQTLSGSIFISPDIATCDDCVAELFDPGDRRFRYPFLNCTNCGPRLTIITGYPYDRERTSMSSFAMCAACRNEYDDPANRRFHAQPIACRACGPRLKLLDRSGEPLAYDDPVVATAEALLDGKIAAVKGLGGYHLACSASLELAVAELRRRKHRDEKPFALMVADLEAARELAEVSPKEAELLDSPRRPIVLVRRKPGARLATAVTPGNPWLGLMLPYTPLHHLLLRELSGTPLVMTSGNRSDEPIAYQDQEALSSLAGIADIFLAHDRPIHIRCDDSVTRVVAGFELPLRRSRGNSPLSIRMPVSCAVPTLALGGQMKATFAFGRGDHAILSHHIGDLDHYEATRSYAEAIAHYERLFDFRAEVVVHDMHPDYASTRYAQTHAGPRLIMAVQHHHAHMASCMAENGLNESVIGVTFDGTGFGSDGTIWGGEFLIGDFWEFRRAAHFRAVRMPGSEVATREPWRMAAAYLVDAGLDPTATCAAGAPQSLKVIQSMLARGINSPYTTSAGRLFDAIASLAGVRQRALYEGQAAIELEWISSQVAPDGTYPFELVERVDASSEESTLVLDMRPMIVQVSAEARRGAPAALIGRRFHSTIVELIAQVCDRLRSASGLDAVVLSGGVFMNALLTVEVLECLRARSFRVYRHQFVPPNDGGICLGQLAVAVTRLARSHGREP